MPMIHRVITVSFTVCWIWVAYDFNRKNDLMLIMTPEKQDKTLELCKHWSPDSTPARNEVIMKMTYPVNQ